MINDRKVTVQCRHCEQCKGHRRRRLLGQVLAEQKTADTTLFVTLTYGGGYDNEAAYFLNYKDVKLFLKKLRKKHKFRYLCVGEYGEEGSRAHWHLLMMFRGETPDIEIGEMVHIPEWEHGHVVFEIPRSKHGTAVYCMKYMDKANDGIKDIRKSVGMGHEYMLEYAREHARAGLSLFPKGNIFTIKGNPNNKSGKPFYYPVERDSAIFEKMLTAWLNEWVVLRPDKPLALSEDVTEYLIELCQDTTKASPQVQEYIEEHYGYNSDTTAPHIREISFTYEDCIIRAHWNGYTLEYHHPTEGRIWHADLSLEEPAEHPVRAGTGRLPHAVTKAAKKVLETPKMVDRMERLRRNARRTITQILAD